MIAEESADRESSNPDRRETARRVLCGILSFLLGTALLALVSLVFRHPRWLETYLFWVLALVPSVLGIVNYWVAEVGRYRRGRAEIARRLIEFNKVNPKRCDSDACASPEPSVSSGDAAVNAAGSSTKGVESAEGPPPKTPEPQAETSSCDQGDKAPTDGGRDAALRSRLENVEAEPPRFLLTLFGALLLAMVFGIAAQLSTTGKPAVGIGAAIDTTSPAKVADPALGSTSQNPVADSASQESQPTPSSRANTQTARQGDGLEAKASHPAGRVEGIRALVFATYGAYAYALRVMIARLSAQALTGRFLVRVGLQAASTMVLGFVIGYVGAATLVASGPQSLFLYFLIGLFPAWTSQLLTARAREIFAPNDAGCEKLPLCLVDGIDEDIADRLTEVGIWDIQHLATSDPLDLVFRAQYPLDRGLDWIDQAILISYVRGEITQLRELGLRGAIDLAVVAPDNQAWFWERALKRSPGYQEATKRRLEAADETLKGIADRTRLKRPELLAQALYEDAAVDFVWRLWQRERQ